MGSCHLTPGEDFDREIADSIRSCDAFSVVVTPNIVEENNYVVTTEYPAAKAGNQPIFFVVFSKTDEKRLCDAFDQGAKPIDAQDTSSLNKTIKSAIPAFLASGPRF